MGILRGTSETIECNVTVKLLGDLGKITPVKCKVTFKRRSVEDAQRLFKDVQDENSGVTPTTILREDIVSWRDMDGEGGEVPFTSENLDASLNTFGYLNAFFEAWGTAQTNRVLLNAKN